MLIPDGLAIITSAICPATSKLPSNLEAAVEFTSFKITRASPVAKNGFAPTAPTVLVVAPVRLLFKTAPSANTSNCL